MRRSGPSYFAQRSHVSFTVILILPDPVGSSHDPYSRCQHVASVDWSRVNTVGHTRQPKINRTIRRWSVMVGLAFTSWEDFLLPHNHNLPTRAKNSLFAAHSPNQPTGCSKFTFLIFSSATRREVPLLLLLLLILLLPSTHSLSEEPFALLLLLYSELHVNHPIPRDGDWIYFTLFFTLLSTDWCCRCTFSSSISIFVAKIGFKICTLLRQTNTKRKLDALLNTLEQ